MNPKTLTQLTILLLTLILVPQIQAQYNCTGKYYEDKLGTRHTLHNPTIHIKNIIDRILTIAEIHDANDYRLCRIERGYHNVTINPSQRYIVYDQRFLNSLARASGEMHWGVVAVMAHEIGHHVFSATGGRSSLTPVEQIIHHELATREEIRRGELKADGFAGYVLAHLGASLTNSQALMKVLGARSDDLWSTHPSSPKRVKAVTIGWLEACKVLGNECNDPILRNRNQPSRIRLSPRHNGIPETPSYSRLMALAESLKGKRVNQNYCKLYASVATQQAKRNQQNRCGYVVDSNDVASQWSLQWQPQYNWCMQMSSYATQRETQYREKKLIGCLR